MARDEQHDPLQAAIDAAFEDLTSRVGEGDTPLDNIAMAQHEVAGTFQKHGFRRDESLYLTACLFTGSPGHPPPNAEQAD